MEPCTTGELDNIFRPWYHKMQIKKAMTGRVSRDEVPESRGRWKPAPKALPNMVPELAPLN